MTIFYSDYILFFTIDMSSKNISVANVFIFSDKYLPLNKITEMYWSSDTMRKRGRGCLGRLAQTCLEQDQNSSRKLAEMQMAGSLDILNGPFL